MEAMIKKMESLLGTVGRPNVTTNWYADRNGSYYRNAPWCQMAITWAAFHSGNYDAVCFGKDYAYTVWHAQRFQQAGQWHVDTAGIRRGDIVFFDWGGSNNVAHIDHVGIVTGVNGRDILTIEGNTSDRCARRVRQASEIVGYGRPAYVAPAPAPKAKPKTAPAAAAYTPPPFPAGLRPGSASPSAKGLQRALKAAGYMAKSVALADNYGPVTQASVRKFYVANASLGWAPDTAIGPLGWAELHREAYGETSAPVPPPPPTPGDDEPAHDYKRVTHGGKIVNARTSVMLERARRLLTEYEWTPVLTQGSYNKGVGASAGTHDGGGVVDIRTSTMTKSGADACVQALRKAGFAAWRRGDGDGMSPHIHAVAIGDREMSPAAKSQIQQWKADTNGLANHGPDPAPDPYPAWTRKYR